MTDSFNTLQVETSETDLGLLVQLVCAQLIADPFLIDRRDNLAYNAVMILESLKTELESRKKK